MDILSYKTISVNKSNANKEWILVDATDKILGRLASEVAKIIRGKHKPSFTPHADCGDYVIVINADKIRLTGSKWTDREHFSYSGYPGGQKVRTPLQIKTKSASTLIEKSVRGMLPKNRLGRELFRNLHVFNGEEHTHDAQKPKTFNFK